MVRKCGDAKVANEDEEKARMDQHMRREIRSLNRKYNKLEKDVCGKQISQTQSQSVRILKHLKDEKQLLVLLIHFINHNSTTKQDYWNSMKTVDDMLQVYQNQATLVEDCENGLDEIGHYVDDIIRMIHKSKIRILASFGQYLRPDKQAERMDTLEDNLYHFTKLFNTRMTACFNMRVDITSMLKYRAFYHSQSKRYRRRVGWLKHQMNTIVDKANKCYDKYDDSKFQEKQIMRRNFHECVTFVTEMKDNVRFLRNDRYNRIFVDMKETSRGILEGEKARALKHQQSQIEGWAKKLPLYHRIFRNIASYAGSADVGRIRQMYMALEQANMATFLTLSFLKSCNQAIANKVEKVRQEINMAQASLDVTARRCVKVLKRHKARQMELMASVKEWKGKWGSSELFMKNLLADLKPLFQLAGCGQSGILKLMGAERDCCPGTLGIYLHIFERRVVDFLSRKKQLSKLVASDESPNDLSLLSRLLKAGPAEKQISMGGPYKANIIIPPGLDKADSDDDERQMSKHPFHYSDLKVMCKEIVDRNTALIKVIAHAAVENTSGSISITGIE